MPIFKKIIQVFIILGIGYFLISYSTENRKYKILNQILVDIQFISEPICIKEGNINYDKEIFSEVNFYDIPSAYCQYLIQIAKIFCEFDDKIDPLKMKNGKIITDCSTEMKILKIDENTETWETNSNIQITLPILSVDKNTAIVQITTNCGMLCGATTLYALRKVNGKWKISNKKILRIS